MRRLICMLVGLTLLAGAALAEEQFDGQVVAGEAVSVTAPFGGTVRSIGLKAGAQVEVNEGILTLSATRVLAPEDGTVRGVFAAAGDSAEDTVLYLAPVSKYTISASVSKAYSAEDTKFVTLGETVYIRCSKDGTHQARGVITAVKGSSYTVQTTAGELYMEETVNIYRTADYASNQCLGTGTVTRTEALGISGTGSILKMYVQDGDVVERGQLLFETVEGVLSGQTWSDSTVRADVAGVVAEVRVKAGQKVSAGDVLMTVYQPEAFQIRMSVPEDMLSGVRIGEEVLIYFNWNEDKTEPCAGVIREISYVSEETAGSEPAYSVYVDFQADETVRLGMNVTVVLP
ncbi:MAG: HlyD family efflux transporter periplasmic adaptor subunit [Aristaeellaceae bacterium]